MACAYRAIACVTSPSADLLQRPVRPIWRTKAFALATGVRYYALRFDWLIIDEFGFDRLERLDSRPATNLLYKIIDYAPALGDRRSLVTTTSISSSWAEYLDDPPLAMAFLDRVVDGLAIIFKIQEQIVSRFHRAGQSRRVFRNQRPPNPRRGLAFSRPTTRLARPTSRRSAKRAERHARSPSVVHHATHLPATFGRQTGTLSDRHRQKSHGGEWGTVTMDGTPFPGMRLVRGALCWPWSRAHKRLMNGPEENIWHYYSAMLADSPGTRDSPSAT